MCLQISFQPFHSSYNDNTARATSQQRWQNCSLSRPVADRSGRGNLLSSPPFNVFHTATDKQTHAAESATARSKLLLRAVAGMSNCPSELMCNRLLPPDCKSMDKMKSNFILSPRAVWQQRYNNVAMDAQTQTNSRIKGMP